MHLYRSLNERRDGMFIVQTMIVATFRKEDKASLESAVKFMFQPAEEAFVGSCNMIEEYDILKENKND